MNQKPPWLLYAAKVREELSKLPDQKSGKRYERHLLDSWRTAMNSMGYEGSLKDWDYLVHNFDRVNRRP